jgi:hypothetical protein
MDEAALLKQLKTIEWYMKEQNKLLSQILGALNRR